MASLVNQTHPILCIYNQNKKLINFLLSDRISFSFWLLFQYFRFSVQLFLQPWHMVTSGKACFKTSLKLKYCSKRMKNFYLSREHFFHLGTQQFLPRTINNCLFEWSSSISRVFSIFQYVEHYPYLYYIKILCSRNQLWYFVSKTSDL